MFGASPLQASAACRDNPVAALSYARDMWEFFKSGEDRSDFEHLTFSDVWPNLLFAYLCHRTQNDNPYEIMRACMAHAVNMGIARDKVNEAASKTLGRFRRDTARGLMLARSNGDMSSLRQSVKWIDHLEAEPSALTMWRFSLLAEGRLPHDRAPAFFIPGYLSDRRDREGDRNDD